MIIHLLLSSLNSANATAGVIGAIAVLLIVGSIIAVIIVIAIICIIKHNRRKGVPEGNGAADNYYSVATKNAVTQSSRIQEEEDYQELDVSKMDDDVTTNKNYQKMNAGTNDPLNYVVMNKRGYLGLDASKRDDDGICSKDYEELDPKMLDETTNYASLK